jgi:DNA-directed RNA polymerase specialized sigma24 family protein
MGEFTMAMDMDEGARKWIYKTARKSFWRVARYYEFEDLVQDGFVRYYLTLQRYPDVTDRPHVMALFKVRYINYIHKLSRQKTNQVDLAFSDILGNTDLIDESVLYDTLSFCEGEMASLWTAINRAPEILRSLFSVLATHNGREMLRAPYPVRKNKTRETLNDRLCSMVGVDSSSMDLHGMLQSYLS